MVRRMGTMNAIAVSVSNNAIIEQDAPTIYGANKIRTRGTAGLYRGFLSDFVDVVSPEDDVLISRFSIIGDSARLD
jgi:hypothetical protein